MNTLGLAINISTWKWLEPDLGWIFQSWGKGEREKDFWFCAATIISLYARGFALNMWVPSSGHNTSLQLVFANHLLSLLRNCLSSAQSKYNYVYTICYYIAISFFFPCIICAFRWYAPWNRTIFFFWHNLSYFCALVIEFWQNWMLKTGMQDRNNPQPPGRIWIW